MNVIKKIAVSIACLGAAMTAPTAFSQTPEFTVQEAEADSESWRAVDPEDLLIFETTKGSIYIEIAPGFAPAHAEQMRKVVRTGLYKGTQFHRVISGFMAQGGDIAKVLGREPNLETVKGEFFFRRDPAEMPLTVVKAEDSNKSQYTGYYKGFPVETAQDARSTYSMDGKVEAWMPHCPGVVSMARTNDPNSAKDQFFLLRDESAFLNRQYTSWGRMLQGLDVARALNVGEPPVRPDILVSASVASDLSPSSRPKAWVMKTDSSAFQSFLDTQDRDKSICDLPQVPAVLDIQE